MSEQDANFQQAMNQGHSAAWDQNWEKAAEFYRQALSLSPEDPQAMTSLGLALIELQEYEEALHCYQKAAKLLPADPLPLEKIAQLCERMGNLELAAQASLRAAELYLKNKDVAKAIENWERVTRLDAENLQAHSRLALVYERLGDPSKAVSEYLAAASALQSSGNPEKARQAIERALKILPGSLEARRYLGLLKDYKPLPKPSRPRGGTAPLRMAQVRSLRAPQAAAPEVDPVSLACQKALTALAGMLFETEDEPEAAAPRKGLQMLVKNPLGGPARPQDHTRMILHLSQAVDLQTRNEHALAADELQHAVDVGLDSPAALFDLGYLYSQMGRTDSAIRCLQGSVKNADFALGARLLLGELLRKKGQAREASFEYLEALKLADVQIAPPDQAQDLLQLYELLIESHRQEDTPLTQERLCDNIHSMLVRTDWRAQLQRARQQLPGYVEGAPLLPLAEVLSEARSSQVIESVSSIYEMVDQGLYDSAMEEAYYTLLLAPTYLPLHSLMGEMLVKSGDIDRAVDKYQVVSRTYAVRGEMQQAIQFSRKVVELAPTDLNARNKLIEQLLAFGKIQEATEEYIQLAEVYYNLANLSMARKVYMEAFKAAQQTNMERAAKIKLLHRVADIDMQSLEWRQALRILEQIRTLQPDDEEARAQIVRLGLRFGQEQQALAELDNYGAYMASNNRQADQAAFLLGILDDYPDNIPLRRRLADAYASAGKMSEAVSQLDSIGEILLQKGDRTGAIQTIEKIISLAPPNKSEYVTLLYQLRKDKI